MKVSKSSWHYKLIAAFRNDREPPADLCGYMRSVIGWSFVAAMLSPLVLLFWLHETVLEPALVWVGSKLLDAIPKSAAKDAPPQLEREPKESLFRAWLRAKKEKVCPLIEFKD